MDGPKSRSVVALPKSLPGLPAPLATALTRAETALMPINPKLLAVRLAETVELWGVPANWQAIAGFYREALESLPADVVGSVLRQARLKFKWLPKPSELFELASEDINDRHASLRQARIEARAWQASEGERKREAGRRPPTKEERAAVAKLVATLPQAQPKRMRMLDEAKPGYRRRAAESLAGFRLPPDEMFNDDGTRRE